jgi:Caspase domain
MMRILVLAVVVAASLSSGEASAQRIRAVLVGDTLDGSIGLGVKANLDHIREFLQVVQTRGEINVSIEQVRDDGFSCKTILATVSKLKVSPDDVVLFYYAGHGFRTGATPTKFPDFDCSRSASDPPAGMSSVVSRFLKSQKPRLLIAIADACNKEAAPTFISRAVPLELTGWDLKFALQRLFLQYKGALLMSGSIPGEYSYYSVVEESLGGYFSNQFMKALYQKINQDGGHVSWEEVAVEAGKAMSIPTDPPVLQHPQIDESQLQLLDVVGGVVR